MPVQSTATDYDGTGPFPDSATAPRTPQGQARAAVTIAIAGVPFAGLAAAVYLAWGHGVGLTDVLLALAFYIITGLGVTIGFHRLLTHRACTPAPALRGGRLRRGRHAPPSSRLHRPAWRSAFPLPVRDQPDGAAPRAGSRPCGLT